MPTSVALSYCRALMVSRVLKGRHPVDEAAEEFGVSRGIVYMWICRYREGGEAGSGQNARPGL
jgi:transposase